MTINLLPPKLKKEREGKRLLRILNIFFSFSFLILFIFTVIIYTANISAIGQISKDKIDIANQNATLKTLSTTEQKVVTINSKLDRIGQIDGSRAIWSNVIKDLANDTPTKVQIKALALNKETNKIDLSGSASTRRDIAAFKDKLEESKYFKNVTFYTSSHTVESDSYSFNLSAELENSK